MKTKLLTLLSLLVLCVTEAWADVDLAQGASYDFTTIQKTDISNSLGTDGYWSDNSSNSYYSNNNFKPTTASAFLLNKNNDVLAAFDGLQLITGSSTGRARIYYNGNGLYFNSSSAYLVFPSVKAGQVITIEYANVSSDEARFTVTNATASQNTTTHVETLTVSTNGNVTLTYNSKKFYIKTINITAAGPTITTQPQGASYVTGDPISALTVAATASAGTLTYQWKSCTDANKTGATNIVGATSASYTPTAAGFYYVTVTDSNGSVDSNVVQISISDASAPTISIDASETSVTAGTSITLTATKDGVPSPTLKWYVSDTNDTSAGSEISGETADTYTFDAIAGTKYYYAKAFNSQALAGVASNVITITAAARTGCDLYQVVYSNSFDAFITDPVGETHGIIKVYYLSGTSAPTISSTNKSGGATYSLVDNTLTLTSEDGNTSKVYDVTVEAVEPYTEDGVAFNGTETWIKTGNAFSSVSGKVGWKFSKNDNDWTREKPGQNRIYFFLGASTSITLANGGTLRNIKVYRNGTELVTPTTSGSCTIAGDTDNAYMIAVVSNQTSGDGAFKSISVTGAQETVTKETITPAKTYTTYVPQHNLDFANASGLTAYIATSANASSVTLTSVDKVPGGTPIVIKATTTGSPIDVNVSETVDDVTGNLLAAGDNTTIGNPYTVDKNTYYAYILVDGKFYAAETGKVAAGKAFLRLNEVVSSRELNISFEDNEATGIKAVKGSELMRNGSEVYNLNGQCVAQPIKGLYIVNGRKVVIR